MTVQRQILNTLLRTKGFKSLERVSMSDLNIEHLAFIATLETGKTYQVLVNEEHSEIILKLICQLENGIKLLDPPLEGIQVTKGEAK